MIILKNSNITVIDLATIENRSFDNLSYQFDTHFERLANFATNHRSPKQ